MSKVKLYRPGRRLGKPLVYQVGVHKRRLQFRNLSDAVHTDIPSRRFFPHLNASLAGMQCELTIERIRAGLELAS